MLYTTISPNRHWYFNESFRLLSGQNDITQISLFRLFKLLYLKRKRLILLDCSLVQKIFILLFSNKYLFLVIHGELGYVKSKSIKLKLYYYILILTLKFSNCNKIYLSRYLSFFTKLPNSYFLEHPGYFMETEKLKVSNQFNSFGAISLDKIANSSLIKLNELLVQYDIRVNHWGYCFMDTSLSNLRVNGYSSNKKVLQSFAKSKFIFLLNDSTYYNIVSGIVIQSIVNKCIIITMDNYPDIISYYEKKFDVNIHLSIVDFFLLEDKDEYYFQHLNSLEVVKKYILETSKLDYNLLRF
jgi:hypothetical protein